MPTIIHLPKSLLDAVDRRARMLRVSRSRLIALALERELRAGGGWSPGFFKRLVETDDALRSSVDELLSSVRSRRTSKPTPGL
jgi:hypothetical protein